LGRAVIYYRTDSRVGIVLVALIVAVMVMVVVVAVVGPRR
jgi:hypothetical protein